MQDNYVMKKKPGLEKLFSYQVVDVMSKDGEILLIEKAVLLDYNPEWFTVRTNGEVRKFLTSEASIQA